MPPKRKQATEFSAKRGKKSRVIEPAAKCNKMAAQQMNVADLQVLLQTALANQGDTFDPTGYAYMSVASGSNYAEFESQDPLAEFQADHDPDQDASDGEETESRSGTENETSVHGGRASNFFDTLLLKPTPNRSTDTGSGAGAAETASSSMFLQDLPFHLAVEEGESVSGVSKQTVAEIYPTNQDAQSENNVLESCELVAHELGVEEIRAMVHFTEADGIAITTNELEELNARAGNDSLFVGLLVTRLIGPARLANMSVTGQASRRFMNLKNPDGSLVHPASEKIDPNIIEFVCDKVAERTAIRIGPDNMATIRRHSDVTLIRKYICQKIANLRKAAEVRKSRGIVEGSGQDAGNIRV